ncbi:hypothetical protein KJ359_005828 [Pestalotiopsis sp. 9143b]|nr:hypothetical protein KJ359_005828 [Pestalotiopsis sp. 9143b]
MDDGSRQPGHDDPAFQLIQNADGTQDHIMDSYDQQFFQNTVPYYQQGHLSNVTPAHGLHNGSDYPEVHDAMARARELKDSMITDPMGPFELEDTSVPRHDPTYGGENMTTGPVELPGIGALLQQAPPPWYPAGEQAHGLAFCDRAMQAAQGANLPVPQYPDGMVAVDTAAPAPLQTDVQDAPAVDFGMPSSTAVAPGQAHGYQMCGALDDHLPIDPKLESKHEFNPDAKPEFKFEFKPDFKPEFKLEFKPEFKPKVHPDSDVDELMAMAAEYSEQKKREEQASQSAKANAGRASKKAKKPAKPKVKKGPTAMQRAPVSVAHDGGVEKSVEVDVGLAKDGLPSIKVRPGSDVQNLADAVARPRDEQLSVSRAPQGPRVKVPYLPIDDTMSKEEQLRRAARNQQISELDRADRRARNNEAARRTRERARQAIVDAQAQVEEREARIELLEAQIKERADEITMLKKQLAEMGNE